jgi:hypothetical protein
LAYMVPSSSTDVKKKRAGGRNALGALQKRFLG